MNSLLKYKLLQSYIYEPEEEKFEFDDSDPVSKYTLLRIGSNPLNNVIDANDNQIEFAIKLVNVPNDFYYFIGTKSEHNKYFTKVGSSYTINIGTLGTNAADEITVYLFSRDSYSKYKFYMDPNDMTAGNIVGTTNQYAGINGVDYPEKVNKAYKNIINDINPLIQVYGYYGAIDVGPHSGDPNVTFGYMIGSAKSLTLYNYYNYESSYHNLFDGASIKATPTIGSASFAYNSTLLSNRSCHNMFNNCELLESADIYICINIAENEYNATIGTINLYNSNIGQDAFGNVRRIDNGVYQDYFGITDSTGMFNNCTKLNRVDIYIGFVNPAGGYYFANQKYQNYDSGSDVLGKFLFWGENAFPTFSSNSVFGIINNTGLFGAIDSCGSKASNKNINIHNVKGSNLDLTALKTHLNSMYKGDIKNWAINIV